MKRLLCIVGGMNAGGAETFLMKMYRGLDRTQYQMDFATANEGVYDDEIIQLGGKIYRITPKSKGFFKNFFDIFKIVKNNRYLSVLRVSQNSLSALELLAAWFGGAKIRGYRSSNSNTVSGSIIEITVHKLFMWMPKLFANVRFAPSTEAAEFMFGKGCIDSGDAFLINNGLDLESYKFDEQSRISIRKELGIENKFVVGHIGRFNQQKNHSFLIDVFFNLKKSINNSVLVLCGSGDTEASIKAKVKELGIENDVFFLGVRSDIPCVLSAMDVFIFPSLYEGMPNTVIEAQANGLTCIISDTITKESKITDLISFMSLNVSIKEWASVASNISLISNRDLYYKYLLGGDYDISNCVEIFKSKVFFEEDI